MPTNSDVSLFINSANSQIYAKKLSELDESNPLYISTDCESTMTLLAVTTIDNTNKKYAIVYGYCPEPQFHIYDPNDLSTYYGRVTGEQLYITGTGSLYTSGHVNSYFNARRKYAFEENNMAEVKQPNYYVGLTTKTLKPLTLYATEELKERVAGLPANYNIEVLLAKSTYERNGLYLIRTSFGLTGWTRIQGGQYQSIDVEGIFWNGD